MQFLLTVLFVGEQLKLHQTKKLEKFLDKADKENSICLTIQMNKLPALQCHSKNICDRKAISEEICMQPIGKIIGKQEIDDKKDVDDWLEHISNNQKDFIAIVGQAHIGKKAVLLNLLKKLKEKGECLYIFYVSLANILPEKKNNILQFLTIDSGGLEWFNFRRGNSWQNARDENVFRKVVDRLTRKETVCIVFDDLEKSECFHNHGMLNSNCSKKDCFLSIQSSDDICSREETADVFVTHILKHGFGNGKNIILLNPWHFVNLYHSEFKDNMDIIHVIGVGHEEQNKFVQTK